MNEMMKYFKDLKNPFADYLGIQMEELREDYARASIEIKECHKNVHGTVHGGVLFALADNCGGGAAFSDGRMHVTQNSNVSYIRAVRDGKVTAYAQTVHRGRKTSLIEVKMYDAEEKLVMQVMLTFYCVQE